jgi:hypothetical protein
MWGMQHRNSLPILRCQRLDTAQSVHRVGCETEVRGTAVRLPVGARNLLSRPALESTSSPVQWETTTLYPEIHAVLRLRISGPIPTRAQNPVNLDLLILSLRKYCVLCGYIWVFYSITVIQIIKHTK